MGTDDNKVAENRELIEKLLRIIEANSLSNQGVATAVGTMNEKMQNMNQTVERLVSKVELGVNGTKPLMTRVDAVETKIATIEDRKNIADGEKRSIKIYAITLILGFLLTGFLSTYAAFIRPVVVQQQAPVIQPGAGTSQGELKREDFEQFRKDMKREWDDWKRQPASSTRRSGSRSGPPLAPPISEDRSLITSGDHLLTTFGAALPLLPQERWER